MFLAPLGINVSGRNAEQPRELNKRGQELDSTEKGLVTKLNTLRIELIEN